MKISVLANCQARPIARLLSAACSSVEINEVPPVHTIAKPDLDSWCDRIAASDIVIHQPLSKVFGALATENLKTVMGEKLLSIPSIYFAGTIPQLTYLRLPQGGTLKGPLGDYHDTRIIAGFMEGLAPQACADSLDDYSFAAQQHFDLCVAEGKTRDASVDIPILDVILARIATHPTMFSFNHPDNAVLWAATCGIIRHLGLTQDGIQTPPEREMLSEIIAAVPADVASQLNLSYTTPQYSVRQKPVEPLALVTDFFDIYREVAGFSDILAFNETKHQLAHLPHRRAPL